MCPELEPKELQGGFAFFDAQMDDKALGLWAAEQAAQADVQIKHQTEVTLVSTRGELRTDKGTEQYEMIINVAGPWAESLLRQSQIESDHRLDLVRGSHLLLSRPIRHAFLVEVPGEDRFCFILPYYGATLLGTTEVRQEMDEPIQCSAAEQDYLLRVYNRYIRPPAEASDIRTRFAGLRPLIRSQKNPSSESREYAIERNGRIITVFGGKWTTAHALGEKVASYAEALERDSNRY
jgi:glycerol-3-phosphate dehydrogenase